MTSELEIYHEAGPKIVAVRLLTLEAGARLRKLIELMMTGQKEISSLTRNKREHRSRWESIDEGGEVEWGNSCYGNYSRINPRS